MVGRAGERRGLATRRTAIGVVVMTAVVLVLAVETDQADEPPPEDYVASESADVTGDAMMDTIMGAPSGAEGQGSDPGEVYVVSGADGSVVVTLKGSSGGDWFGYAVAVAGDLNGDGFEDLIIGAPKKQAGWAYVFYGPFDGSGAIEITAADADMAFSSPDTADYEFGEAVAPASDINGDGVPELRIRAWFTDSNGFEKSHTYIVSGATGEALFRITGDDPFDPWAPVEGDADGDGDVDQDDLDVILANQGLAGADLTALDGDINGDGVVDMTDFGLAQANFGSNLFAALAAAVVECVPPCYWDCPGLLAGLPVNVDPECEPILCPQDAACAYVVFPLAPAGTVPPPWVASWGQVLIQVYPHGGDSATWTVVEGGERIEILDITSTSFLFRTIDFGVVVINVSYDICDGGCNLEIPLMITWIDSDSDGLSNNWEQMLGLDPNNPDSDGDTIPDGDEDADGDGLSNHDEFIYGTDPGNPDSDGDGVSDGDEVAQGSDPNDASDGGMPPLPEDVVEVTLQVGDHSDPPTELWFLRVGDIQFKAPGYRGVTPPEMVKFLRGESYPITVEHVDSILPEPAYNYTAHVTPEEGECAIVDDPEDLLGVHGPDACSVPCSHAAGKEATLIVVKSSITEIKGLYKSDGTYEAGFVGDGRVYSNRVYDTDNPAETIWTEDKQHVDITVQVNPAADVPANAKIVWEAIDVDDPSNGAPAHPTAGQVLDPNDYDLDDNDNDGTVDNNDGNDNTGSRDGAPIWAAIHADYALSNGNETAIKDGVSKVRFNVTDDGGDNFKVKATVKLDAEQEPCEEGGAETGILTVWKLIDLEYGRMQSAAELPTDQLNIFFERSNVQWRIDPQDNLLPDLPEMGHSYEEAMLACAQYVKAPPDGTFVRAGQGGWFFLVSALRHVDLHEDPVLLFTTPAHLGAAIVGNPNPLNEIYGETHAGTIFLPDEIPVETTVGSIRLFSPDGSESLSFRATHALEQPEEGTLLEVQSQAYDSVNDPNDTHWKTVTHHGWTPVEYLPAKVFSPGLFSLVGWTPPEPTALEQNEQTRYQGRTIVYSQFGQGSPVPADEIQRTMIHELTHALGFGHRCGIEDFKGVDHCVMMYNDDWLLANPGPIPAGPLQEWSGAAIGFDLCGQHLKHIRQADLEDDASAPGRILGW